MKRDRIIQRTERLSRELAKIEGDTLSEKVRKLPHVLTLLDASILLETDYDTLRRKHRRGEFKAKKIFSRFKCDPAYISGLIEEQFTTDNGFRS